MRRWVSIANDNGESHRDGAQIKIDWKTFELKTSDSFAKWQEQQQLQRRMQSPRETRSNYQVEEDRVG